MGGLDDQRQPHPVTHPACDVEERAPYIQAAHRLFTGFPLCRARSSPEPSSPARMEGAGPPARHGGWGRRRSGVTPAAAAAAVSNEPPAPAAAAAPANMTPRASAGPPGGRLGGVWGEVEGWQRVTGCSAKCEVGAHASAAGRLDIHAEQRYQIGRRPGIHASCTKQGLLASGPAEM